MLRYKASVLYLKLFFLVTGLIFRGFDTQAQILSAEQKDKSSLLKIEWFKPEITSSQSKDLAHVILTGKAKPGYKLYISTNKILLLTDAGQVQVMKTELVTTDKLVVADERGFFEMNLNLPLMTSQLPIKVESPDEETAQYQINLSISEDDVVVTNQKDVSTLPYARRKWGIWGGIGYNYLKYDQDIPVIPSSIGFHSFAAPSLFAKVVNNMNSNWQFQSTVNRSPGKALSSSSAQVTHGNYDWTILTGEFTYFPTRWKVHRNKFLNEFGIQAGLQYHSVPFFARSSATDETAVALETNSLLMMAVGGTWLIHYSRYWLFETYLRYQYLLQSGSLFKIEPKLAVDGSVGTIYKWKPNWRVGVFWYGQWHQYSFQNAPDKYLESLGGAKVSGEQSLFFSNLEFRVGYEFE